ncbi:translation initiation factor IF-2-like isoform X2 [Vulpes lagopus]|uniref:translation initiation factor IF-2-like isoform X2 n=1 Tax=Vulpes lagopus TaxID=494514 RepID=UPI001BC9D057|nr:translation initiation factor IF-2-like isoform X2 [Vulpes lagopus]
MRADADGRRGPGRAPISEGPGLPEAPRRGGRLYRKGAAATGASRASRVPLPTHDTRGGGSRKPRPYKGPGRKAPGKQGPGRCDPPAGAPSRPSPAGSPGPRCRSRCQDICTRAAHPWGSARRGLRTRHPRPCREPGRQPDPSPGERKRREGDRRSASRRGDTPVCWI